ncbi:MAG: helix-turn-helix domain-containing protein [Spirochaetota bacterium]
MGISIAFINSCSDLTGSVNSKMFLDLYAGMHAAAVRSGITIQTFDLSLPIDEFIRTGRPRHYDAFIGAIPRCIVPWQKAWNTLEEERPCVNIMVESERSGSFYVGTDERRGMDMLVSHLVKEGQRNIGFALSTSEPYSLERLAGFTDASKRFALTVRNEWIFYGDRLHRRGMRSIAARKILGQIAVTKGIAQAAGDWYCSLSERPTALMCDSPTLAVALKERCRAAGTIDATALTAFDDEPSKTEVNAITTVRQDFHRIGSESVRRAAALVYGKRPPARLLVRPTLIVRASSKRRTGRDFRRTVEDHITRHYRDDDAKDIAAVVGMNRDAFGRKCKRVFGTTYIALLNDARLAKVAEALTETKRSVTDILYDCGFHNYQNFCMVFKKRFAMTPRAYRDHGRKN